MKKMAYIVTLPMLMLAMTGCSHGPNGNRVAITEPEEDPVSRDLKAIQGRWTTISVERNGKTQQREFAEGLGLRFEGEKLVASEKGLERKEHAEIRLYPQYDPKRIDLIKEVTHVTFGGKDGQERKESRVKEVTYGIYRIDGDKLTLCLDESRRAYPERFATKVDSGLVLAILERAKP
jgi:uncharacterized protein (TIGR03067 family)